MITELNDYQQKAIATMKEGWSKEEIDKYCIMKLLEENGELASIFSKHYYHGKEFKRENVCDEMSDIFWYLANLAYNNGFTLSEIATHNIEKLKKRHGESYNPEYYK